MTPFPAGLGMMLEAGVDKVLVGAGAGTVVGGLTGYFGTKYGTKLIGGAVGTAIYGMDKLYHKVMGDKASESA